VLPVAFSSMLVLTAKVVMATATMMAPSSGGDDSGGAQAQRERTGKRDFVLSWGIADMTQALSLLATHCSYRKTKSPLVTT
jgi:hypothetical protein